MYQIPSQAGYHSAFGVTLPPGWAFCYGRPRRLEECKAARDFEQQQAAWVAQEGPKPAPIRRKEDKPQATSSSWEDYVDTPPQNGYDIVDEPPPYEPPPEDPGLSAGMVLGGVSRAVSASLWGLGAFVLAGAYGMGLALQAGAGLLGAVFGFFFNPYSIYRWIRGRFAPEA